MQVNILEAKTNLSRLVRLLETREEDVIYLARNNKIVAEIKLHQEAPTTRRIGVAKGKLKVPEDFDRWDKEIEAMFEGDI